MKTKKKIFLFAFGVLCFISAHTLNAQVTIGAETAPEVYSLLELNTSEVKAGLRLPQLTTTERTTLTGKLNALAADKKAAAKGLTIFNTTTNCTDTWNGTTWISNCSSNVAPQITTQPRAFSWKETVGAGNLTGIGGDATTISVTATGVGTLSYQWYEVPTNVNAQPTAVSDGSGGTTASFTPDLSKLGMRRYFCRVTDTNLNSVNSEIAEVAVGCGAKTVQGGWLKFMCYNLGATITTIAAQKSTSSVTYSYSGTTASDTEREAPVYGDLYQWGRKTDGHEKRTSGTQKTQSTNDVATAPTTVAGKFIYSFSDWAVNNSTYYISVNAFNWRNHKNAGYDPCDNGWRVPSQDEWASILNGNSAAASGSATANTWTYYTAGGTKGYEIKPDGLTTTLFLPTAGYRSNSNGELYNLGTNGSYWSGTSYSTYSLNLTFNGTAIYPAHVNSRAYGLSVRCVSEF